MRKNILLTLICLASAHAQDSNSIMGFETPFGWAVNTRAGSTTTRTQGALALQLRGVAGATTLASLPVVSTASALTGLGNPGATFEVDTMLPPEGGPVASVGSLKMSISAPAEGLNDVSMGQVSLVGLQTGMYTSLKFAIPDAVRVALGSTPFRDLTFTFILDPGSLWGTYLFDNLRVHSVPTSTAVPGMQPPPGFGGSVDLVVNGPVPATQMFDIGVVQVPAGLHLKAGQAAGTSVQLALGFDGVAAFACTYMPDATDASGKTYGFASCTGGFQAGDLVSANWAQLTIVGGNASQQLRVQLAKNPVGDQTGRGIIPALPTFWGDTDGCVPQPAKGTTFTLSPSCAGQVAQANQIVTSFFQQVRHLSSPPDWLVTPVPGFASRSNGGSTFPQQIIPSRVDPPFDFSEHLNANGSWDAYYRLFGNVTSDTKPDGQSITHFEATFTAHAVLDGYDADIVTLNTTADTNTGSLTAQPSSTGQIMMTLFGNELFGSGPLDTSIPINKNLVSLKEQENAPPIEVWIFTITLGATAQVDANLSGTITPVGITLNLAPHADLGAHATGGVDVVIASGGVDVNVELLDVKTPMSAHAQWDFDRLPQYCSAGITTQVHGDATIGSLGGKVDLVASFGPCPFCDHESWNLFSWNPLLSTTKPIFDLKEDVQLFPLPTALCQQPVTVTIFSPGTSVISGQTYALTGQAVGPAPMDCHDFTWSLSPPPSQTTDRLLQDDPCHATVVFADPVPPATSATRTLTLTATANITDSFRRPVPQTGSASETITINSASAGAHILGISPKPTTPNPLPPTLDNASLVYVFPPATASLNLTLQGGVSGAGGRIIDWTATDSHGKVQDLGAGAVVNWQGVGYDTYTVAMMTSAGTVRMTVAVVP